MPGSPSALVWSGFLIRFAKHLALLLSLLILGRATRQLPLSEAGLLALAAGAALLHLLGRALERRVLRVALARHDSRAPEA